jgi:hypothetical protein
MALQKIPGRAIQLDSQVNSDVMYHDGTDWVRLAKGTAGEVLSVNEAGTFPTWGSTWQFQGDYNGYSMGGNDNTAGNVLSNVIERNSYASDTDSVDVGDLVFARNGCTPSWKSMTHGYVSGGSANTTPALVYNQIEKFQFAASSNAVDTADLVYAASHSAGHSSALNCYASGGGLITPTRTDRIEKFVKATEVNSTDIANLTIATGNPFGSSSTDHGFTAGGTDSDGPSPDGAHNVISRFSFSTDSDSTDVGDLATITWAGAAGSSLTHGYISGGYNHTTQSSARIEKYAFASTANATQIAVLTVARGNETLGPSSSTTHGYAAGGMQPGVGTCTIIDKYSFVTDANATDVGDLTSRKTSVSGTQN